MKDTARGKMISAIIRDEMNNFQEMTLENIEEYTKSLLVRILSGLSDDEIEKIYNDLEQ